MGIDTQIPPRNGEGDRPAAPGGGGIFDTSRKTIVRARRERRSGNLPEVLLWGALRGRPEQDLRRDAALTASGFHTLRIPARDVLADLDAVVAGIEVACRARLPLRQPAAGPPPRSGEVFSDERP